MRHRLSDSNCRERESTKLGPLEGVAGLKEGWGCWAGVDGKLAELAGGAWNA